MQEASGEFRRLSENFGCFRRIVEASGELWRLLENFGDSDLRLPRSKLCSIKTMQTA